MTEFTTNSLTYIGVRRHSTLILPNSLASHLKLTGISLATFKTNTLIFLLLGLTVIYKHFFKLKLLIVFSLVEGEAVAVSARNGTFLWQKRPDLTYKTTPFPKGFFFIFLFSPKQKNLNFITNNGSNILPVMQM